MNKKGISLVEIIVSITLISIILIILFRILMDVRYYDLENEKSATFLINNSIIINNVESSLIEKGLKSLSPCNNTIDHCLLVELNNGDVNSLIIDENVFRYGPIINNQTDTIDGRRLSEGRYTLENSATVKCISNNCSLIINIPYVDENGIANNIIIPYTYDKSSTKIYDDGNNLIDSSGVLHF